MVKSMLLLMKVATDDAFAKGECYEIEMAESQAKFPGLLRVRRWIRSPLYRRGPEGWTRYAGFAVALQQF